MRRLSFTLFLFFVPVAITLAQDGNTNATLSLETYSLFLENNHKNTLSLFQGDPATADTTWQFGGMVGLNFSQSAYVNWAAGGENSISYTAMLNTFLKYQKGNSRWNTTLDLAYGQSRIGEGGRMKKIDDRIDFNSKYGYKMTDKLFLSALMNFRTQFDLGYNLPNDSVFFSEFMSPAYLTLALGLDYIPSENFSVMLSPIAGKMTMVMNQRLADAGSYGVEPAEYNDLGDKIADGKNVRLEMGASLMARYNVSLVNESINFATKLQLFSNYLEKPGNIDVNWEGLLTFKINDFLNASIAAELIYDDDIHVVIVEDDVARSAPRTQFREVLSIGLAYNFR